MLDRFTDGLLSIGCEIQLVAPLPGMIDGDLFRIEQVMVNLLTNAMKYGSKKPIEIKVESDTHSAKIFIQDHGIGIQNHKLSKIFNRFEQAISHNNISGLDLGLYIAKEIVSSHHGSIQVKSKLGHGSLFTVELPIQGSFENARQA